MQISQDTDADGKTLSKRKQMDRLYEELRTADLNRRLEVSRNFGRTLVEHKNFVPQDPRHRIEIAERAALELRELISVQEKEREDNDRARRQAASVPKKTYQQDLETVRINNAGIMRE
jgi:chromatin segregation and condensation protein Rec8/ScpA/Scc1 (kleisin family)